MPAPPPLWVQVTNKRKWASVPGTHEGGPDGMDFDCEGTVCCSVCHHGTARLNFVLCATGNLLVANWGGGHLEVYDPSGKHIQRIKCPFKNPSNLHFKPDTTTVYVTEHEFHAVWSFEWQRKGQPQYCDSASS